MQIAPAALAKSLGTLRELSPEFGMSDALRQVVVAAGVLFSADGVGLMLLERDSLRFAVSTDPRSDLLEAAQEKLGTGPCSDAFTTGRPVQVRDFALDDRWPDLRPHALEAQIQAVLCVPVAIGGTAVGTLDVLAEAPRTWTTSELSASEAYAAMTANLLVAATNAHAQGELAAQLEYALDQRVLIEQAKGFLMARHGVSADTAFERLRTFARRRGERVTDVARAVIAGDELPSEPEGH